MRPARPVSVARFERKLRAILGAAGSSLLTGVEEHIQGLIVLEADRPEWGFAGGETRHWDQQTAAALAGSFSGTALTNPPNSGVLVIVEQVQYDGSGLAEFFQSNQISPPTGSVGTQTPGSRDLRFKGLGGAGRLHQVQNTIRVEDGPKWRMHTAAAFPFDFIIAPGSTLYLWNTAVNLQHLAAWQWREVPLEASLLG